MMKQLQEIHEKTGKPIADVIREAMSIGLADWELTGYDTAKTVARAAVETKRNSDKYLALVAEQGTGYGVKTAATPPAAGSSAGLLRAAAKSFLAEPADAPAAPPRASHPGHRKQPLRTWQP